MNKLRNLILTVFILILFCNQAYSQLSASFNYSSLPKFGLGYQFSKRIWTEFRSISNTKIDDFTPELIMGYNIIAKDKHNVYLGLGVTANYFSGFVAPVGLEFFPIETFNNFSLRIELEPAYTAFDTEELFLFSSFGVKYRFGNKK